MSWAVDACGQRFVEHGIRKTSLRFILNSVPFHNVPGLLFACAFCLRCAISWAHGRVGGIFYPKLCSLKLKKWYWSVGSGSALILVGWIRTQEGKNDLENRKKFRNFMFYSAGCSLLKAEGFLDVLCGGLGISKLQFLILKNISFFSAVIFFLQYLVIKSMDLDPDPDLDPHWPKMLCPDLYWNQCGSEYCLWYMMTLPVCIEGWLPC